MVGNSPDNPAVSWHTRCAQEGMKMAMLLGFGSVGVVVVLAVALVVIDIVSRIGRNKVWQQ
jgi:hypothetical protein